MSTLPAVPDDLMVGLEDIDASDLTTPRLKILGKKAVFQDSQTNEEFPELDVIVLGLVKQRTLWTATFAEGEPPLCRSYDHDAGFPQDGFPWKASGYDQPDLRITPDPILACNDCSLKEWGTHPKKENAPWCMEQFTLIVIHDGGPALLTLQSSGLKNTKNYLSGFARSKTPTFTARTTITLTAAKFGQTDYAIPNFQKGAATDQAEFAGYADLYRQLRHFLVTPRSEVNEEIQEEKAAAKAPVANADDLFDE